MEFERLIKCLGRSLKRWEIRKLIFSNRQNHNLSKSRGNCIGKENKVREIKIREKRANLRFFFKNFKVNF